MKNKITLTIMVVLAGLAGLAVLAPQSWAGAPLTCHPFDIGKARSLPWDAGADSKDWNTPKIDYDTRRLADDTVALLADSTPVIVRMETIRRAALYGQRDRAAAEDLYARLKVRSQQNAKGSSSALCLFDYGYLIETYKQAGLHPRDGKAFPSAGENGYALVLEALGLRASDAEMEFAAAVISSWPLQQQHQEHFRKAVAGASGDALLASNLLGHFSDRGSSLAQLRASASRAAGKN